MQLSAEQALRLAGRPVKVSVERRSAADGSDSDEEDEAAKSARLLGLGPEGGEYQIRFTAPKLGMRLVQRGQHVVVTKSGRLQTQTRATIQSCYHPQRLSIVCKCGSTILDSHPPHFI